MKTDDVTGLRVLSIKDGTVLGKVKGLTFHPRTLALLALRIEGDDGHAMIAFADVQAIGADAVTVPDDDVVQWARSEDDPATLLELDDLNKLKVVDDAGNALGEVHDVELDLSEGRVTELVAREGGFLGLGATRHTIRAADIISLGPDVLIVRAAAPATPAADTPRT